MRSIARVQHFVLLTVAFLPAVSESAFTVTPLTGDENRYRRLISGTQVNATTPADALALARRLAGRGVTIMGATILGGNLSQFGFFENGTDSIKISSGVIISTGKVTSVSGPNKSNFTTYDVANSGYPPLDELLGGNLTKDAAVLQINFTCRGDQSEEIHLQYVWASDEYNEYVSAYRMPSNSSDA
jgi:hypothetical protein